MSRPARRRLTIALSSLLAFSAGATGASAQAVASVNEAERGDVVVDGSSAEDASSLRDLWMRVRPRNKIQVIEPDGRVTTGLFVRSTTEAVTLLVVGSPVEIPSARVGRINRIGHRAWQGLLTGLLVGGTIDAVNVASDNEYVGAAVTGAFLGTLIGRFIPRRVKVYEATSAPATSHLEIGPVSVHARQMGISWSF